MAYDAHANLCYSLLTNSPGTGGTSFALTAGTGSYFPTAPFNCTVWPAGVVPTQANAEIVRVTAVNADTLTVTRAQEGTSAIAVAAGYQFMLSITALDITAIEAKALGGTVNTSGAVAAGHVAVFADTTGDVIEDGGAAGTGTVTSVAFVGDGVLLSSTPSTPVTTSGDVDATLLTQSANTVLAGPSSGSAAEPSFRSLVIADVPTGSFSGDASVSSAGVVTNKGLNGSIIAGASGTGGASYNCLPCLMLMVKTVAVQTTGSAVDIATITLPAGITRFRTMGGSGSGFSQVINEGANTAAAAAFTIYTAANAGGSAVTQSFSGPAGSSLGSILGVSSSAFFSGVTTLYIHQTSNSANAANLSFYLAILPIN